MNLKDMSETKKSKVASRALKENYNFDLKYSNLNYGDTKDLLKKVKGLIAETKKSKKYHLSEQNSNYMKLVILEQGLSDHLSDLTRMVKIINENEELKKSQVLMAAQSLVDSVQKMLEDISKLNVEELNAVVSGIKNEFGDDIGNQFNTVVGESFNSLLDSINNVKQTLDSAISGVASGNIMSPGMDMDSAAMPDMSNDMEPMAPEMDADEEIPELPVPSTEKIGRERR